MQWLTVFTQLFQSLLHEGAIPSIWKTSLIVPVAKKPSPKETNDYMPVAFTSVPFKCAEKNDPKAAEGVNDWHARSPPVRVLKEQKHQGRQLTSTNTLTGRRQ